MVLQSEDSKMRSQHSLLEKNILAMEEETRIAKEDTSKLKLELEQLQGDNALLL